MRYVVQLLIPVLIIAVVALVLTRNKNTPPASAGSSTQDNAGPLSTGTFMVILVIGAVFTVALVYALHDSG